MRKAVLSFIATGLLLNMVPSPAGAHGANSETYTANAPVPFATSEFANDGGCHNGVEDVNKDGHSFSRPMPGVLNISLTNASGDWDIHVIDEDTGSIIAASFKFTGDEFVSTAVQANQRLNIEACNFAGGPTATVSFTFDPSAENFVSVGDALVHEGDSGTRKAVFNVSLSKPSASTVTVDYATNRAGAGDADYTTTSGTLSFLPGTTSLPVKVPVAGDSETEGDETFSITLSSPSAIAIGDGTGVGTIVDDDGGSTKRRVAIGDVTVHEGDAGVRTAVFNVALSKPAASTVTVSFATANSTATGDDYTIKSGTVSFAPGTTNKSVKVEVIPDTLAEVDETFTVELSNATGAIISDASGAGTIIDAD